MKIFSSLLLLTGMGVSFLACKKDDSNTNGTNQTANLTASPWVYESSFVDFNRNGTKDADDISLESAGIPSCRLDNKLTFKADGTATADEGTTKCSDSDPQTTNFNWSFADAEKSLVITNNVFSALNSKFNIKTLNSANLTVTKDTTVLVVQAAIVLNLKH